MSVKEAVRAIMSAAADEAIDCFRTSVHPIYGASESGNLVHIGTCILVAVDTVDYLVTAAHIIDENENTSIYVGVSGKIQLIEGNFFCTKAPGGDRSCDRYDFAWMKITGSQLEYTNHDVVSTDAEITNDAVGYASRFLVALGYPNSKNKKHHHAKNSASPKLMNYSSTATIEDELCEFYGGGGQNHIFLKYDKKHARDSTGTKINSIEPKGCSGGLLVDMGRVGNAECLDPDYVHKGRVAGLLIENKKSHNAIVAVRFGRIVKEIRANAL